MNLERVQKYYELIDRELGLESDEDLFGFESDEEDDLFGFESEEDDLFGFESEEDDLFGFESEEDDLFGFEYDEYDLFGTEGVKDVFGKVKGGIKKGWKAVINFIKKCIAKIKSLFGVKGNSSDNTATATATDTGNMNKTFIKFSKVVKTKLVGKTVDQIMSEFNGTKLPKDMTAERLVTILYNSNRILATKGLKEINIKSKGTLWSGRTSYPKQLKQFKKGFGTVSNYPYTGVLQDAEDMLEQISGLVNTLFAKTFTMDKNGLRGDVVLWQSEYDFEQMQSTMKDIFTYVAMTIKKIERVVKLIENYNAKLDKERTAYTEPDKLSKNALDACVKAITNINKLVLAEYKLFVTTVRALGSE